MKLVLPIITLPPLLPLVVNQLNFWTFLSYQHIINNFFFFLNVQFYVMMIDLCMIHLCFLSNFIYNYIHLIPLFSFLPPPYKTTNVIIATFKESSSILQPDLLVCLQVQPLWSNPSPPNGIHTWKARKQSKINKTKTVTTESNKVSNMSKPLRHITKYVKEHVRQHLRSGGVPEVSEHN
jgi:hypothetical protein